MSDVKAELLLPDMRYLQDMCGPHHSYVQLLEAKLAIRIELMPQGLGLSGGEDGVSKGRAVLEAIYEKLDAGHQVELGDVEAGLRLVQVRIDTAKGNATAVAKNSSPQVLTLQKRTISPRTPAQAEYVTKLGKSELVFGVGPAGTGKTYLAVAYAASLLLRGEVERVILSRPAVEAGERIGFLPGDMKEKVDPYLRPLYDALYDVMHSDFVDRRIAAGDIEIAPLAFMRGRTLTRAAVILDEAQNATAGQMKMFLTRLGEGSRMVITGDPSQTDLPPQDTSGLGDALHLLSDVKGVSVARFSAKDVVRHKLVARIVTAYEKRDNDARAKLQNKISVKRSSSKAPSL